MGQGWVRPAEFWRLPPGEVWWILDAHLPPEAETPVTQNERLYQLLTDAIEETEQ